MSKTASANSGNSGNSSLGARHVAALVPRPRHEARPGAGEYMEGALEIAALGFPRLQLGEVAQDLLLAAGDQGIPARSCRFVALQRRAEPGRHWMRGAASVGR